MNYLVGENGPEMVIPIAAFHEEWFGEASQQALADLVSRCVDVYGIVIEIGSWEGRSTCALANAAWPRTIHAVDTWEGSGHEISAALAAKRDVYAQWSANVGYWTRGNVTPHRMGWRDFLPTVTNVAFAFIDAEHSYIEVRDNILALLPLMTPGGIICGDDNHHPPVRQAVTEVLGNNIRLDATLWIYEVPA